MAKKKKKEEEEEEEKKRKKKLIMIGEGSLFAGLHKRASELN